VHIKVKLVEIAFLRASAQRFFLMGQSAVSWEKCRWKWGKWKVENGEKPFLTDGLMVGVAGNTKMKTEIACCYDNVTKWKAERNNFP